MSIPIDGFITRYLTYHSLSAEDDMDKNALDFARKLGRRVRELRERKGLTQDRAAELAGITGKYWGEVERGSVAVSAVVLDGMRVRGRRHGYGTLRGSSGTSGTAGVIPEKGGRSYAAPVSAASAQPAVVASSP